MPERGRCPSIGLALHELATNAGKYGALSVDPGRVEVGWRLDGDVFAMWHGRLDFSISAAIGFISLFGVSVMSGILIINDYNNQIGSGLTVTEAMFIIAPLSAESFCIRDGFA
jgi:two-component sensor histidine kinase